MSADWAAQRIKGLSLWGAVVDGLKRSLGLNKRPNDGMQTKTLLVEPDSGLLTMLLQMAPGAKLPDHEHVLIEQTWVLQGSLVCGEGVCKAGDFVWRPAGSRHEAWAGPEGGLMLGIFQIPNRFFQADGKVVDFAGNAWEPIWADALARQEQARFDAN